MLHRHAIASFRAPHFSPTKHFECRLLMPTRRLKAISVIAGRTTDFRKLLRLPTATPRALRISISASEHRLDSRMRNRNLKFPLSRSPVLPASDTKGFTSKDAILVQNVSMFGSLCIKARLACTCACVYVCVCVRVWQGQI